MEYALAFAVLLILSTTANSQNLLWSRNYGGQYHEFGHACVQSSDGDIYILGSTYSYGSGDFDIYLVQTDSAGNSLGSSTFGGPRTDYGYDIDATSDGGFIIVGSTKSFGVGERDVYLVKLNADGAEQWSKTYGGVLDDEGRSVRQTTDNGFIICGGTYSSGAGYQDVFLIKTDAAGNIAWQRTFGGTGGESGSAVRQMPDGGYIVVGSTGSFGDGYSSIYAIRTDAGGNTLWTTTYGGAKADYGYSVEVTLDGGMILAGATASFGAGSSDAYLIKTDPSGYVEWEQTYGGADDDRAYSVMQTASGDYLLAGNSLSFSSSFNVYLVKTSPVGDLVWSRNYGGLESDYCEALIRDTRDNTILIGRSFSYTAGGSDIYLLKVEGDQITTDIFEPVVDMLPAAFELRQNYPNPFNMNTAIEFSLQRRDMVVLTIVNMLGQRVKQWSDESLAAGTYRFEWDGTNESGQTVASGVYLYSLQAGSTRQSKKMVLLK